MSAASNQSLTATTSLAGGFVGGLVHAGVAVVLWNQWFDSLWEMLLVKPLNGVYLVLGMFLLGFVPVLLYLGAAIISPTLIVAVCLLGSGFASWLAGPVGAPSAVPTPFGLYILFWVGVIALAGLTGRVEYRRKQRATG